MDFKSYLGTSECGSSRVVVEVMRMKNCLDSDGNDTSYAT